MSNAPTQDDLRLRELSRRRSRLDNVELTEFLILVGRILNGPLANKYFLLLKSLPYEREDYINDYFCKILKGSDYEIAHTGALKLFFWQFLISQDRKENPQNDKVESAHNSEKSVDFEKENKISELPSDNLDDENNVLLDSNDHENEMPGFQDFENQEGNTINPTKKSRIYFQTLDIDDENTSVPDNLKDHSLDLAHDDFELQDYQGAFSNSIIMDKAIKFLNSCPPNTRLMLKCHYCADDEKVPMLTLAQRYGMGTSYHYQAQKLGVVSPKTLQNGTPDFFDYYGRETLIGKWLQNDLGINVCRENLSSTLSCLKILCHAALNYVNIKGEML